MSEWQPIETYDAMKKKPSWAVFYVELCKSGRNYLNPMLSTNRYFGQRNVTHWMLLPEPPVEIALHGDGK